MKLLVFITLPDGKQVKAGTLDFGDVLPGGRYQTTFTYAREWLIHPGFFPLDPESLDPETNKAKDKNTFESAALSPPLSVFHDSLPDDWGRRLLVTRRKLEGVYQENPYLLKEMGATALGALSFFDPGTKPIPKEICSEQVVDLDDLIEAAERFQAGDRRLDERMLRLLSSGGSPGGARPKVLASSEDGHWIAKFPSKEKDNGIDVVGLEGSCMALARKAGVDAARTTTQPFTRGNVLLVERFDLTAGGGRNHMISLRTLCKETAGVYALRYKELMDKIRLHSCQPEIDVSKFFRQMVFNAVIGNTDDHLKNFAMIRDVEGYKLSKAFDLVPDILEKKEHMLLFNLNPHTSGAELVEIGRSWDVKSPRETVLQICKAVRGFRSVAVSLGVSPASITKFGAEIESRASDFQKSVMM
jgi:serine/threonine-protein kinase HipA